MAFLLNLKILHKVLAALGMLLLCLISISGVSVFSIREIDQRLNIITRDRMPAIDAFDELKYRMVRHRLLMARYAMADNPEQISEVDSLLITAEHNVSRTIERAQPFITAAIERESFAQILTTWSYVQGVYASLKIATNRTDSTKAETIFRESLSIFDPMMTSIDAIISYNEQAAQSSVSDAHESTQSAQTAVSVFGLVALLLGIGGVVAVRRTVVAPIGAMTAAMRRLSDNDMETDIPAVGRKDEVGAMAAAVQIFKDNMIKADALEAEAARERQVREQRAAKVFALTQSFDQSSRGVVEQLGNSAAALQKSATAMSAMAEQTSRQATAVAAGSEQASTNVQTVATAAEELSASIREISRQVADSSTISQKAVTEAEKTSVIVQDLVVVAAKIGSVTQLIQLIADQTNLLALNATIEAARAGDAGKGFAVVASEVKHLANQTSKATEEISSQVTAIQAASTQSVEAIQTISDTIRKMNDIAAAIAAAVEEQGAATAEIARNVQQASAGTSEVSSNIAGVTQAAANTGEVSGDVKAGADEVSIQAEVLKREVDTFISSVRAA